MNMKNITILTPVHISSDSIIVRQVTHMLKNIKTLGMFFWGVDLDVSSSIYKTDHRTIVILVLPERGGT